jgi:hypothetical protein
MALEHNALLLTPFWQKERRILVRTTEALRLCRDGGYEHLPGRQANACLAEAALRDRAEVCDFILRARLTSFALSAFDDLQLHGLLRELVESADFVVLRECAKVTQGETSSLARQRRLVRAIETEARKALSHEGRRYRLVADADLHRLPNRDAYDVVSRRDALVVLEGLARLAPPGLASLLAEAHQRLAHDWRPPLSPDGLILLKQIVQRRYVERPVDASGWRPGIPRKSVFDPSASPEADREEVDQTRQATTLIKASQDGVPFCEECAR